MSRMDFFAALFTQPVPCHPQNPATSRMADQYVSCGRLIRCWIEVFDPAPFGRRERRLATYARYRSSLKGWERTLRYNASEQHAACNRRYREWHPRTAASYQNGNGSWVHPVKVDPQERRDQS